MSGGGEGRKEGEGGARHGFSGEKDTETKLVNRI